MRNRWMLSPSGWGSGNFKSKRKQSEKTNPGEEKFVKNVVHAEKMQRELVSVEPEPNGDDSLSVQTQQELILNSIQKRDVQ